jgi:hypothetical protein
VRRREQRRRLEEVATLERQRIEDAIALAEGALHGYAPRRGIWDDADYLTAILAVLSGDWERARCAALAHRERITQRLGGW